ncbi:MAG: hypothetical protein RLZZ243_251 [Bacteroidota bacterium]
MQKQFVFYSGIAIMVSIVLGAMGAHALKEMLEEASFNSFEVAVRYQGFLSMGIFMIALNADRFSFPLKRLLTVMFIGMLLFCGSIYLLVTFKTLHLSTGLIGPITPIGGAISILSWCVFLYRLIKN